MITSQNIHMDMNMIVTVSSIRIVDKHGVVMVLYHHVLIKVMNYEICM